MSAITPSRLTEIAQAVNAEHAQLETAMRESLARAVRVGELLTEAKMLVKHGAWGGWIAGNCTFSERTAQNYMRIAARFPELGKSATVADLTYREALALLANPAPRDLEIHELGYLFPFMDEITFSGLVASIKVDGFNPDYGAIVIYQGKILDGKCRYEACKIAGAKPVYKTFPDDFPYYKGDALNFVISANMTRAHYQESQTAIIALNAIERLADSDKVLAYLAQLESALQDAETISEIKAVIDRAGHAVNAFSEYHVRAARAAGEALNELQAKGIQ